MCWDCADRLCYARHRLKNIFRRFRRHIGTKCGPDLLNILALFLGGGGALASAGRPPVLTAVWGYLMSAAPAVHQNGGGTRGCTPAVKGKAPVVWFGPQACVPGFKAVDHCVTTPGRPLRVEHDPLCGPLRVSLTEVSRMRTQGTAPAISAQHH